MFQRFFRRPGFANSLVLRIGLLILFSLAAFTLGLYQLLGRQTLDRLGETQLRLAAEQVEARYTRLRRGVETTLRSSQAWGMHEDLHQLELQKINDFFFPIVANHGEINSAIIAHQSGREVLVLFSGGKWINRVSNPAEWGKNSYWITWNGQRQIEKVELRPVAFDARQRPWYQGAAALSDSRAVHWTEPYVFFTTRAPGVSAAMRWAGRDGQAMVIAHDVQLSDISEHTTHLKLGQRGQVALLQGSGKLFSLPNVHRFDSLAARGDALLKTPLELDLSELAAGYQATMQRPGQPEVLTRLDLPDGRWLSLFRRLQGDHGELS